MLKRNHHPGAVLHFNRTQREHEPALLGLRDGRFEVLVATDTKAPREFTTLLGEAPSQPRQNIRRIWRNKWRRFKRPTPN